MARRFHQVGWQRLYLCRVPSWEWPGVRRKYGRLGAWENDGGISFRVRDFILRVQYQRREVGE